MALATLKFEQMQLYFLKVHNSNFIQNSKFISMVISIRPDKSGLLNDRRILKIHNSNFIQNSKFKI